MTGVMSGLTAILKVSEGEIMSLGNVVRVKGQGNKRYVVVELSSPVRSGDWVVRSNKGSLLSVSPDKLRLV